MRSSDQKRIGKYPISGKYMVIGFGIAVAAITFIFLSSGKLGVSKEETSAHGEPVAMHWHIDLKVINADGSIMQVPAGIGISPELWHDHSMDSLGISGLAPIHTHDSSGQIHIEAKERHLFTLGNLLDVWGFDISKIRKVSTNFEEHGPDYYLSGIALKDGTAITIELK